MRKYLNKYGSIFLGFCLFAWIGYIYAFSEQGLVRRPIVLPLMFATFLVIQGIVPIAWIKNLSKEKKVIVLGVLFVIVEPILLSVFQLKLLAAF